MSYDKQDSRKVKFFTFLSKAIINIKKASQHNQLKSNQKKGVGKKEVEEKKKKKRKRRKKIKRKEKLNEEAWVMI